MKLEEYFLNPGELIVTAKPIVVRTVLGSCASVTICDKENKIGGICHYLLPQAPGREQLSSKYGDVAIKLMLHRFLKQYRCKVENLVAMIIGGAFIVFDENEIFFIGDRNVQIATEMLKEYKIKVRQMHTGGEHGRKLWYNTGTNELIVKTMEKISIDDLYNPII